MFKNVWRITFRNLFKKPIFTAINVLGLGLGMASCLIISLFVLYDLSYDDFQDEHVYRLALNRVYPEREVDYAFVPHSVTPQMVEDFPEVIQQARIFKVFAPVNIRLGEDRYNEENVLFADSSIFNVLSIPLIYGEASTALSQPESMVITRSIAMKLFGKIDVIGETVETPNGPLSVAAVAEDYPKNSHFDFDYLFPLHSIGFFNQANWTGFSCIAYIKTGEGVDPIDLQNKFPDLIRQYADGEIRARNGISYDEYIEAGNGYNYTLQPIKDIHLHSKLEGELKPNGNITYVYIFSIVAVFILVIASINFMNLSTARSTERGKEVGIRKVLGSTREQLIVQFLVEALVITVISCLISLILVQVSLPFFNDIANRPLSLEMIIIPQRLLLIIGVVALVGILSGIYPAFFISAFSPLRVMKGELKTSTGGITLRNALVVVQFAISIALISATLIISKQMNFLMDKSLGYDQSQVMVIDNAFTLNNLQQGVNWERFETFKNEINQLESVISSSYSSAMPGDNLPGYLLRVPGTGKESMVARNITFDHDMLSSMKMELVDGRFFEESFNDSLSMILNETAITKLGIQEPVIGSKIININNDNELVEYTIIGVVNDFHFQSLHIEMEPIAITSREDPNAFFTSMVIRINGDNYQAGIQQIEEKWNLFVQENPISYYMLDSQLASYYDAERATMKIFGFFTMLAIVIACIGLLGLSAFIINQRIKEIGVRKVLGASSGQIVWLLSTDFGKLILISSVIAVPLAYLWIQSWLENFAYSISIPWLIFGISVLIALIIGMVTISIQTFKAAAMNPVKSLRDE
jgi:putative ABC transport system permease protein